MELGWSPTTFSAGGRADAATLTQYGAVGQRRDSGLRSHVHNFAPGRNGARGWWPHALRLGLPLVQPAGSLRARYSCLASGLTALKQLEQLLHRLRVLLPDLLQELAKFGVALRILQVLVERLETFRFLMDEGYEVVGDVVDGKLSAGYRFLTRVH